MTIGLLLLLASSSAHAFTLASAGIETNRWTVETLSFAIDSATCGAFGDVQGAMEDAIDLWNTVPTSSIKLELVTSGQNSTVTCTSLSEGVAGVGTPLGDLSFNSDMLGTMNRTTLSVVAAHEIGHVLGLGHSGETKALMYYSVTGVENLKLSADDIAGITYLYPRDELSDFAPLGCGTVDNGRGPGSGFLEFAVLFLLLFGFRQVSKSRRVVIRSGA